MTPEEINQRIATWLGLKCTCKGAYLGACEMHSNGGVATDYYRTNAAMDLLVVLVERGCTYKMLGAPDTHYMAIGDSTGYCPMAATKCQKTPSAAICHAIIELVEREGK